MFDPGKWIAGRVQIGTTKGAKSLLHHLAHEPPQHQSARFNKADGQLELSATSGKAGGLTEVERLKAAWPFGR